LRLCRVQTLLWMSVDAWLTRRACPWAGRRCNCATARSSSRPPRRAVTVRSHSMAGFGEPRAETTEVTVFTRRNGVTETRGGERFDGPACVAGRREALRDGRRTAFTPHAGRFGFAAVFSVRLRCSGHTRLTLATLAD